MANRICPKCSRSVIPIERLEKDGKKYWLISYCPDDRCRFNFDLEEFTIKEWNSRKSYFEDYT